MDRSIEMIAKMLNISQDEMGRLYLGVRREACWQVSMMDFGRAVARLGQASRLPAVSEDGIRDIVDEVAVEESSEVQERHIRQREEERKTALRTRFADLVKVYGEFVVLCKGPSSHEVTVAPMEIYANLDDADYKLAQSWVGWVEEEKRDAVLAQMLSARGAERAASRFYQGLGFGVADIAVSQLSAGGRDWKTHDLLLDGDLPVDVKNARTPSNDKSGYVSHCVPKFKSDRRETEVVIAGVLSPYLQLKYIKGNEPISVWWDVIDVTVLGEASMARIRALAKQFTSNRFEVKVGTPHFLPPWMFDYPDRFYGERDSLRRAIRHLLSQDELPSKADYELLEIDPVLLYQVAGVALPRAWQSWMEPWAYAFVMRWQATAGSNLDLPTLYLYLVSHFVGMIREPAEDYHPSKYLKLLSFMNLDEAMKRVSPVQSRKRYGVSPLGIYDPLNVILNLCWTFGQVWDRREEIGLHEFETFNLYGTGLLQGCKSEHNGWITIWAYCGGWIEDKGKCGKSPLILGQQEVCEECGKLICDAEGCGFCEVGCAGYKGRNPEGAKRARWQSQHEALLVEDEEIPF